MNLTVRPSLQILAEWFGRTIIRSCTKLSYEHAQSMIESPTRRIPERELPAISPEHTCDEVHRAVLNLHGIAKELRRQRFADGALRLDQVSRFLFSTPPTDLTSAKAKCVRELAWQPWGLSLCPFLSLCLQIVASEAGGNRLPRDSADTRGLMTWACWSCGRSLFPQLNSGIPWSLPILLFISLSTIPPWMNPCILILTSLCPTLCDPMDCSPPGSSVHGQEYWKWVAILFTRRSSRPRNQTRVFRVSCFAGGFLTTEPPGKLISYLSYQLDAEDTNISFSIPALLPQALHLPPETPHLALAVPSAWHSDQHPQWAAHVDCVPFHLGSLQGSCVFQ